MNCLNLIFFIPSYQRGYRWTESQVEDLLNDIWEFIETERKNEDWYCLQPVIVKAQKGQWKVIDGQQRLTTIFLILKHLEKFIESDRKTFQLEYETRNTEKSDSKDFLNNVGNKTENESIANIDYFHIHTAFTTIQKWFREKAETHNSVSSEFISPFLKKTKVIWYETEGDEHDIFTRINMGKIPLTNAELIKALFLNSSNFRAKKAKNEDEEKLIENRIRLKQLEIANEWDFIEYSLHNDEFWLFINEKENEKETRIELLFELLVGLPIIKNKNGKDFKTFEEYYKETEDNYYTYREFDKNFKDKSEEEIEENWKQVKRYFQTLQDWFDNRELYHKIGFLVTNGTSIKTLIEEKDNKNSEDFRQCISDKIKNTFQSVQLHDVKYGNGIIKPLLLLHNIQTMLNNEKENSRFPFNRYKSEKWDIEHIHAKASEAKVKDEFEEQRKWIIENFEKDNSIHSSNDLNHRINSLINNSSGVKDKDFQEVIEYVLGEEDDYLQNLCLLDRGTNRSYKNDSFKNKRKKIIKEEKNGTFIPICTRNVFLKYYSEELKQLGQWAEADRAAYFDDIKDVLKQYLPTQNEN